MKHFVAIALLLTALNSFGQKTAKEFIQLGIEQHDKGAYSVAITFYKKALKIDPASLLANYEISLSYMYHKLYEEAIIHCDQILKLKDNERFLVPALMTKGSCLDALGKGKEAIKVYESALVIDADSYLLHYNMALTQHNLGNNEAAIESAVNAISSNPNHGSSHLLLGYIMEEMDHKIKSILSLNFFLFLEANTNRSPEALQSLMRQFEGNVKQKGKNDLEILVNSSSLKADDDMKTAELMLSLMTANNKSKRNKKKTAEALFIENSESLFSILSELKEKNSEENTGLWWDFYVVFYSRLIQSPHLDTYCYYIQHSTNTIAADWLNANEKRVEAFNNWLGSQQ